MSLRGKLGEKEIQAKEGLTVGAVLALMFDRSATGAVKNYQSRRIKDIKRKRKLNLRCQTNQIARMSAEDEEDRKKRRNRGQKEDIHRLQSCGLCIRQNFTTSFRLHYTKNYF